MRLLLIATLACTFAFSNANFHISSRFLAGTMAGDYKSCPSNYWNCDCYSNGDRAGTVTNQASGDFFSIDGMCGVGQMNFYKDSGANSYTMYINGGNGEIIGQCYPNQAEQVCGILELDRITDLFVCYTYVCGS